MRSTQLSRRGLLLGSAIGLATVAGLSTPQLLGAGGAFAKGRDDGPDHDLGDDHGVDHPAKPDDHGKHRNRDRDRDRQGGRGRHSGRDGRRG